MSFQLAETFGCNCSNVLLRFGMPLVANSGFTEYAGLMYGAATSFAKL